MRRLCARLGLICALCALTVACDSKQSTPASTNPNPGAGGGKAGNAGGGGGVNVPAGGGGGGAIKNLGPM